MATPVSAVAAPSRCLIIAIVAVAAAPAVAAALVVAAVGEHAVRQSKPQVHHHYSSEAVSG